MSYILDALKRADAERERGAVPGLHAQPVVLSPADGAARRWSTPAWLALVFGAALAAVLGWQGLRGDAAAPAVVVVAPAPPAVATAPLPTERSREPTTLARESTPRAPDTTLRAPGAVARPPANVDTVPQAGVPARSAAGAGRRAPGSGEAIVADVPRGGGGRAPSATLPSPALPSPDRNPPGRAPPLPPSNAAADGPPAAMGDERLPTRAELPDDVRRALPNLAVGGSIYSANPADRLLILNGQLFHEHDVLAPGFVLEQIRPKAAVLSFQGRRFELPY